MSKSSLGSAHSDNCGHTDTEGHLSTQERSGPGLQRALSRGQESTSGGAPMTVCGEASPLGIWSDLFQEGSLSAQLWFGLELQTTRKQDSFRLLLSLSSPLYLFLSLPPSLHSFLSSSLSFHLSIAVLIYPWCLSPSSLYYICMPISIV